MENVFQFQYESEKLNEALGLKDNVDSKCIDIVVFATASNYYIANDLFEEDLSQAPKSLTTFSGDLEKSLSLCSTDQERGYVLLTFRATHDLALDLLAKMKVLNSSSPKEQIKLDLLMKLLDLKISDMAGELNMGDVRMSPSKLLDKLKLVKDSKYDFNKYLSLAYPSSDIDNMLKNVFSNEQKN